MKLRFVMMLFVPLLIWSLPGVVFAASYSYGDSWKNNPLGFEPLNLHTVNGIVLPALTAGAVLMLTESEGDAEMEMYVSTGFYDGYKHPDTQLSQQVVGLDYLFRRYLSVGIDLGYLRTEDGFNNAEAVSVTPFFRFYPYSATHWRFYFESGAGLIRFNEPFPMPNDQDGRLGTETNGISRYGVGVEMQLSPNYRLGVGVRHTHISNGDREGVERNPSHDSNGINLALRYRLH